MNDHAQLSVMSQRFAEYEKALTAYYEVAGIWSCSETIKKTLRYAMEQTRENYLITSKNFFREYDIHVD